MNSAEGMDAIPSFAVGNQQLGKNWEDLFAEGTAVPLTNIAGARFVSQEDARILEEVAA